jgi:hypothetical protein
MCVSISLPESSLTLFHALQNAAFNEKLLNKYPDTELVDFWQKSSRLFTVRLEPVYPPSPNLIVKRSP